MRNKIKLLMLMAAMTTMGYAASIDHIQTYTPEYLGNPAQNGLINKSSAYYNPAGLVNLENGKYIHAGLQVAVGHEKMSYDGKKYQADLLQPIPNFAAYIVEDDSALYWTFGGLGGGGDLKYKNGVAGTAVVPDLITEGVLPLGGDPAKLAEMKKLVVEKYPTKIPYLLKVVGKVKAGMTPTITNILGIEELIDNGSSAEGKNLYAQTTLGKTFKVNNKLSLSGGVRLVHATRELKANIKVKGKRSADSFYTADQEVGGYIPFEASLNSKRTAWGYGFQLGANYKVNDRLNLAARYDSRIKLNMKAKGSNKNADLGVLGELGFANFYPEYMPGAKYRRDLPAILALGGSYKVTDEWKVGLSGNFYFNKQAKMDRVTGKIPFKGAHEVKAKYRNGWELALGTEYQLNEKWAVLGGINYAYTGAKVQSFDDVEYALNSTTVALGAKYTVDPTAELTFGLSHMMYQGKSGNYSIKYQGVNNVKNPTYDKQITAIGVSYTKKF